MPVIAADGISYEKEAIRRWFATGRTSSPWTNQPLPTLQLIPNRAVGVERLLQTHRLFHRPPALALCAPWQQLP